MWDLISAISSFFSEEDRKIVFLTLWKYLSAHVPILWWEAVVAVIGIFSAGWISRRAIANWRENTPPSYVKQKFKGVLWRWEWSWDNLSKKWILYSLTPYCPEHDLPLVDTCELGVKFAKCQECDNWALGNFMPVESVLGRIPEISRKEFDEVLRQNTPQECTEVYYELKKLAEDFIEREYRRRTEVWWIKRFLDHLTQKVVPQSAKG